MVDGADYKDGGLENTRHARKLKPIFSEEPVIKVTVENSTVHKGEEIELTCTGRGLPAPSLTWLKGTFYFSVYSAVGRAVG